MKLYIEDQLTGQYLSEIMDWLKDEYDSQGEGFYCNKDIIIDAYYNNELIGLMNNNECIGIAVWRKKDIDVVEIDIFVINPAFRLSQHKIGSYFFKNVVREFQRLGYKIIELICAPIESKFFWIKQGFIKVPDNTSMSRTDSYYYIIQSRIESEIYNDSDAYTFELYEAEPYKCTEYTKKWTWKVSISNNKLSEIIIHPCNCNWNLLLFKNGTLVQQNKVKYFTDIDFELYQSRFLIIDTYIGQ